MSPKRLQNLLIFIFATPLAASCVTMEKGDLMEQRLIQAETHVKTLDDAQKRDRMALLEGKVSAEDRLTRLETRIGETSMSGDKELEQLRNSVQSLTGTSERYDHDKEIMSRNLQDKLDYFDRRLRVLEAKLGVVPPPPPKSVGPDTPLPRRPEAAPPAPIPPGTAAVIAPVAATTPKGDDPEERKSLFKQGKKLIQDGDRTAGRRILDTFITRWPADNLTDDSQFWIAQSWYDEKNYKNAVLEFQKILDKYKKGDQQDQALFMLGKCFVALKMKDDAKLFFEDLLFRFPDSTKAPDAKKELEKLKK